MKRLKLLLLFAALFIVPTASLQADDGPARRTVRLLTVGNSLSQDATHYLGDLAKAAGHTLVHHECAIGGGSLEQHWQKNVAREKDAADPAGRYPSGKSLLEELQAEKWDVVSAQQVSSKSHDIASYRPFAGHLRDLIARHAPTARLRVHQTWQYRADSWQFTGPDPVPGTPRSADAMYAALSQAYREIAKELNAPLIPVGDAFHRAIASGKFADKPDADFDFNNATRPALPRQSGSLYVGWQWKQREDGKWKLVLDDRHASIAGRYLGACVWFESLFGESCEGNCFVPAGLDSAEALELQRIAHKAGAEMAARPLLLANYYCWHHDGQHAKRPFLHWTYPSSETNALAKKAQRPGEPPPNSAFRPLAGFYDSADPKVAEWHVQLAKAAGIDAFLVDWWDTHNGLDQNVDRGIVAAAGKHGFHFALLDERAQFHQKFEDYQAMLARALKRYKDHPSYLRIDGRPVVYLYQVAADPGLTAAEFPLLKKHVEGDVGPVYWIVDKIAHDHAAGADRDREKRIPADWLAVPGVDCFGFYSTFSNFRAHDFDALVGRYRYMTKLAHDAGKKMLLPVHPGHDNSYFRDDPYVMPRRDGQTLRDYLRAATDAGADYIMVTSWNEWPESTVVEPSSSWADPYQYLKILAEWKGVSFTAPPLPLTGKKSP